MHRRLIMTGLLLALLQTSQCHGPRRSVVPIAKPKPPCISKLPSVPFSSRRIGETFYWHPTFITPEHILIQPELKPEAGNSAPMNN